MSTTQLSISSESEAWDHIRQALAGGFDDDVVELNFDNWPAFHINVKGERYNSTMTTSMMRSLVELQVHLYRVYAEVAYGKSARSLTAEERSSLEIVYKISQGSSDVEGDLSGFFSELGKTAMEKMTGRQVVTLVAGVAVLLAGVTLGSKIIDAEQSELEESNRHELAMALLAEQPQLQNIQNDQAATLDGVLKSVSDADAVQINDVLLDSDQLEELTKQERDKPVIRRIDGSYQITSLKIREDSYKLEVSDAGNSMSFMADLQKGAIGIDGMKRIFRAFSSEKKIGLMVVGKFRGEVLLSAYISGTKVIGDAKTAEK